MSISFCPACGSRLSTDSRGYCVTCGESLARWAPPSDGEEGPAYPAGLLLGTRLLAAACMFSAMAAVLRFEVTTLTGRILAVSGVLVSLTGQMFAQLAGKPERGAWISALLTLFWIGLALLAVAWLVALA